VFEFTSQKYTNLTNVWYENIFIGTIELCINENPDVDWPALREDKTLKLDPDVRWLYTWKASSSEGIANIGKFPSKQDAAAAILNEHYKKFEKENDERTKN
jgi:hypothetical protein